MIYKWNFQLLVLEVFITFICGSDVKISFNDYCSENFVTTTALYTGSANVTYVEWYYSGDVSGTLIITASTCTKFANPTGYPSSTAYTCDTSAKTYTLSVIKDEAQLPKIFGATFGITPGSTAGNLATLYAICHKSVIWRLILAIIISVVVGALTAVAIMFLIKKYCPTKYCSKKLFYEEYVKVKSGVKPEPGHAAAV